MLFFRNQDMSSLSLDSMWNNIQSLLPSIENKNHYSRELLFGNFHAEMENHNLFSKFEPHFADWQLETNHLIEEATGKI